MEINLDDSDTTSGEHHQAYWLLSVEQHQHKTRDAFLILIRRQQAQAELRCSQHSNSR